MPDPDKAGGKMAASRVSPLNRWALTSVHCHEAMKTIPLSLLIALAAAVLPVSAQEPSQQPNVRPVRPRMNQPMPPISPENAAAFPGNVKLTLEGNLFGVVPTDFSIVSGGQSFYTDLPVKMDAETPIIGSLEGTLTPGLAWTVQISLSARVPMKVGNSNIEFRDFRFRTSARVTPGKKITLWEKDGQKLVLGLEELPD